MSSRVLGTFGGSYVLIVESSVWVRRAVLSGLRAAITVANGPYGAGCARPPKLRRDGSCFPASAEMQNRAK